MLLHFMEIIGKVVYNLTKAHFTLGVRGQYSTQNPAFLLVQKLKSASRGGFTLRSQGLNIKKKKKKTFQSAPSTY